MLSCNIRSVCTVFFHYVNKITKFYKLTIHDFLTYVYIFIFRHFNFNIINHCVLLRTNYIN